MNFRGKHILVMGAKRSGLAATELLLEHGARVRAMDAQPLAPAERARFDELGVPVVAQELENMRDHGDPDLVVLSPGVPYDLSILNPARSRGVPVIGEVELASYFLNGPIIGITGSNGKTTTTALTGHVLKQCGIPCQVGGNIGFPVTSMIDSSRDDQWNVLELSSFQLETICHFRSHISACLNVTPDHLDRHHTFENYSSAKRRLFETQHADDLAVLNYDDETCRRYAEDAQATVYWFSSSRQVPSGIWLDGDRLLLGRESFMSRAQIKLRGVHNLENVMAAALIAHLAGVKLPDIAAAIESFPGVEHRIEFVREVAGIEYYNDSKATNVDATLKAIAAFPRGLWIILGGKDKGSDYAPLREPLRDRAKAVLLIGAEPPYRHAAAPLIKEALGDVVPIFECGTLQRAVHCARKRAEAGDVVLLSPACASYDQFDNYEDRGNTFKHLVQELF